MATRLYYVANSTPPISPAPDAGWNGTTQFVRRSMDTVQNSATESVLTDIGATGPTYAVALQLISPPLAAQTISGTVDVVSRGREMASTDNVNKRARHVRLVDSTGATKTVLVAFGATSSTTELSGTTLQGQTHATGNSIGPVAVADGDYLVIEIGYGVGTSGTTPQATMAWGGVGTDHANANSDTTGTVPWSEFSQNLVWQAPATTSVSSDVDLRWAVKSSLNSDVDLRWAVKSSLNSDVDLRWATKTSVSSDSDLRWKVLASTTQVTSDVDLQWATQAQINSDVDLRWKVAARINSDADLRWRSYSRIQSDVDLRWVVNSSISTISSDLNLRWISAAQITSDADLRWRVAAMINADTDLQWVVLDAVDSDLDLRWVRFGGVTDDLELYWTSYTTAGNSDLDLRWVRAGSVSSDVDLQWIVNSVAQPVFTDVEFFWVVKAAEGWTVDIGDRSIKLNLEDGPLLVNIGDRSIKVNLGDDSILMNLGTPPITVDIPSI